MEAIKTWLTTALGVTKNSLLFTNSLFVLIQVGLEEVLELEFVCPCNSWLNIYYALAFFVVPPVVILLFMCTVKCYCDPSKSCTDYWDGWCNESCTKVFKAFWKNLCYYFVPPTTWLIILFMDGRYFACAMTSWSGKYENTDTAKPLKWCKPENFTQRQIDNTQLWYVQSQITGFVLALVLAVAYFFYWLCFNCCKCNSNEQVADQSIPVVSPSEPQEGNKDVSPPGPTTPLMSQHRSSSAAGEEHSSNL